MSTGSDDPKKQKPSNPSDAILGALKPRTGKETSRWIAGLADDTISPSEMLHPETGGSEDSPASSHQGIKTTNNTRQAVITILDHIFDCFQQY
jgi:hypothetical protein